MKEIVNRTPTKPNRMLITPEGGGAPYYATVVREDDPTEVGTPIDRALLMGIQGMEDCATVVNTDGSITQTYDTGVLTTKKESDSIIKQTFVGANYTIVKTITINADGSISEVIS